MKKLSVITLSVLAFFLVAVQGLNAQTIDEAGTAFNNALQLKDTDANGAITAFKECISICEKLGDEGNELKSKAMGIIPGLYLKLAKDAYAAKNNDEAIKFGEQTIEASKTYNSPETEGKAKDFLAQLYYGKGNELLKAKDVDNALVQLDKALAIDAKMNKAVFSKMLVYKEKDDIAKMKELYDLMVTNGPAEDKYIEKGKGVMAKQHFNAGVKSLQAKNAAKAVESINESLKFGDGDANAYYYLTLANNMLKKWDDALASGAKALELEQKDQVKVIFELAKAYEGKGDKVKACENYKKVTTGPNAAAAKYQIEQVLKCK